MEKFDIFISYSRKDLYKVKQIKSVIEETTKAKCWMDLKAIESGSSRFTKDIVDGINQCQVFLFMLSQNSQDSKYALKELDFAEKKGKHIVIVNIDGCSMNDEFLFLYGMSDTISWDDEPQREKLLRDLKRWIGRDERRGDDGDNSLKEKENIIEEPICMRSFSIDEVEGWNKKGEDAYYAKNYSEAVKWYRKAAEQGIAFGQFKLGWMYQNGYGVGQDYSESLKWYRKSAEQGNANGQDSLGDMYYNGYGVVQDYFEAVKWYRKAAEQGDASGQFNLGWMYEHGFGLKKSMSKALQWYEKAAAQRHEEAKKKVAELKC